jgi:hypothetical protein
VQFLNVSIYYGIRRDHLKKPQIMNANYATNAGTAQEATHASNATYATEATHSISADKAVESQRAINSTYCIVAKEAERLNLAGNMIYIDPENHYMLFMVPGGDAAKSITFDLVNGVIYNASFPAPPPPE